MKTRGKPNKKKMWKLTIAVALGVSTCVKADSSTNGHLRRKRSESSNQEDDEIGSSSSPSYGGEGWELDKSTTLMAMGDIWEQTAVRAEIEMETERLLAQTSPDMSMPTRPPSPNPPPPTPSPTPPPSPTQPPVDGPTPAPVDCLMGRTREEYIFDLLVPITSSRLLNDPTTPQGMAFDYMANDDPGLEDPCQSSTIEQRYGLTTFYFSTEGDDWTDNQGWLGPDQECEWSGVECYENSDIVSRLLLPNNNMVGSMPNEILTLDKLERIDFYTNAISGTLPGGIASLTDLILFDLERNFLTGMAFPDAMLDMRSLVAYRVSENFVSGTITRNIDTLENLQQLWAGTNSLSGTIPTQIASPPDLQSIFLNENAIIGSIPSELGNAAALEDLRLYSNTIQGTIPPELFSATKLHTLMLDFNFFSGTVPAEIGQLTELVDLGLDTNSLTGEFPAELSQLSMLENFFVNNNFMSGQFPNAFSNFQNLDFFDIANNLFSGTIPETIFGISALRLCYMSNNTLTGTIPFEYSQAPLLRDLYLDGNGLTGTVPSIITGELQELTEFLVNFNSLTGSMPTSVCDLRTNGGILDNLFADCGGADPEIECDFPGCCNRCFERGSTARRGALQLPPQPLKPNDIIQPPGRGR